MNRRHRHRLSVLIEVEVVSDQLRFLLLDEVHELGYATAHFVQSTLSDRGSIDVVDGLGHWASESLAPKPRRVAHQIYRRCE